MHSRLYLWFTLLAGINLSALAAHAPRELIVRLTRSPRLTLDGRIAGTGISPIDSRLASGEIQAAVAVGQMRLTYPEFENIVLFTADNEAQIVALSAELEGHSGIEWVARNNIFAPNSSLDEFLPNDSLFSDQWWLERISAPAAWEHSRGDSQIVIGVIDTGIDYLHPDLIPNLWLNHGDADSNGIDDDNNGFIDDRIGWDFVDAPTLPSAGDHLIRDNDPMDEFGHGTFVAGVAAAATDNQRCVSSVGFNCRIMCLRAGNREGYLEEDDIAAAILYAAANGAAIINMSFGDVVASPLLREACRLAYEEGVVQVASAGNGQSQSIHYPSGFPEVIAVGATDQFDRRASFSNYGPSVDLMAPGTEILSTVLGGDCGTWLLPQGTSYSSPLAAGVAGLILSVNPAMSPDDVKQVLRSTADDLRGDGWDPETTHGRLNALRAVQQAAFGSDVVARVTRPPADRGIFESFVVCGEAWGAAFDHFELAVGLGENPASWTTLATGLTRHYDDSLGVVDLPDRDTVLIVRLDCFGTAGQHVTDFRHLYVQRTAPHLDSLNIRRMLDGDSYADLVQVWTNQATTASFILTNSTGDSLREDFGYVAGNHAGVLSADTYPGRWNVRVLLRNQAGFETFSDPFEFNVTEPPFVSSVWQRTATNLRHGYLGRFTSDYDCDSRPEIWYLNIGDGGMLSEPLQPMEWTGSQFVLADSAFYGIHIPQAVGDADGDGLLEMLGRNGATTRIWEQSQPCRILDTLVFEATNFLGAGFYELFPSNDRVEILARKRTGPDSLSRDRYLYYQASPEYVLTPLDTLPNASGGSNDLGPPIILVGDLDGDTFTDVLYGDYDGDLNFCEWNGSEYTQNWTVRLPLDDATAYLARGDFDGDGVLEFVAGCRSGGGGLSESSRRSLHWEYFIFEMVGNDQFVIADTVFILGSSDVTDYPVSVTAADVNADNRDEILISAFPDFYIMSWDQTTQSYLPVWYDTPSTTNTCLVTDWNGNGVNEFFASDGEFFGKVEDQTIIGQRPLSPIGVTGEPLSQTTVRLIWRNVSGADSYRVYRAQSIPEYELVASDVDTTIELNEVPADIPYAYVVTTVDAGYPVNESGYSFPVVIAANAPPSVEDSARFVEPHFVLLRFSETMGESAFRSASYRLQDQRMPGVVLSSEGGRVISISFDDTLAIGDYVLTLSGLRDAQGTRLPPAENQVYFRVDRTVTAAPAIVAHRLVGPAVTNKIEIQFSLPMSETVLNPSNFVLDAPRSVSTVRAVNSERTTIELALDPRFPVGAIGNTVRLRMYNLTSSAGVAMDTSAGRNELVLGRPEATLENVYVYPNPFAGVGPAGDRAVMFAGLPERATIRIFSMQGILVREFNHDNSLGGSRWDLRNEDGHEVASGIYLYSIESSGEIVRGKFAVLR